MSKIEIYHWNIQTGIDFEVKIKCANLAKIFSISSTTRGEGWGESPYVSGAGSEEC